MTLEERFWEKVEKTDTCWIWRGATNSRGYGVIQLNKKAQYAHRVVLELVGTPVSTGLIVCHRCDNPPCVRPDHLFIGTVQDNSDDMKAKGRQAHPVWHAERAAKLSRSLKAFHAANPGAVPRRVFCPAGHLYEETGVVRDGRRRCSECDRIRNRRDYWLRLGFDEKPARKAKTHCVNGHPWVDGNLYHSKGRSSCKTCHKASLKRKRRAA